MTKCRKTSRYLASYEQPKRTFNRRCAELHGPLFCFVTIAGRLFHYKIAFFIVWSSISFHFCLLLSQAHISLHTVDVVPHTQVLARCPKLNNLKCSSVVRLYCSQNEVYSSSEKRMVTNSAHPMLNAY